LNGLLDQACFCSVIACFGLSGFPAAQK